MMKRDQELFDETAIKCSKLITQSYSNSFTLGIKTLDEKFHSSIYGIYGFVRFADEIVDSFLDRDRRDLLDKFRKDTYKAIEYRISFNPVLHAFQLVVNRYKIGFDLIDSFFRSMEMDLTYKTYDEAKYREYVYGSAEVVGLMCLRVFCEGDEATYQKLRRSACRLGSAFQKVNFLRDIKSDYKDRGRIYFPGVKYESFDDNDKRIIEADIEQDFVECWSGMEQLPEGAKNGVKIAYVYFIKLFTKIKSLPAHAILQKRIRISNYQKFVLMLNRYFYVGLNLLIILGPLMLSFEHRVSYFSKWSAVFPAIFLPAIIFVVWDVWFARKTIWKFNSRYTLGKMYKNLPIEEWLFFFTVPYSCLFLHESFIYLCPTVIFQPFVKSLVYILMPIFLGVGLFNLEKRYTCINFLFAAVILGIHYLVFDDQMLGRFFMSYLVHLVPFVICNGILTGGGPTDEPVVIYNNSQNLGIRFKTIPIEDFVYSMTLLLMNVTVYEIVKGL